MTRAIFSYCAKRVICARRGVMPEPGIAIHHGGPIRARPTMRLNPAIDTDALSAQLEPVALTRAGHRTRWAAKDTGE